MWARNRLGICAIMLCRLHIAPPLALEKAAPAVMGVILSSEYLSATLTPHPLPTKDGGVLRTVGDARAYILTLPKTRRSRAHWKRASLLLTEEVGAAALTRQVQVALVIDGKLDPAFERMSNARRWRDAYKQDAD